MHVTLSDPMAPFVKVYYEGLLIKNCVELDTDEGWIRIACSDDRGKLIMDENGGTVRTDILEGNVTVDLTEWQRRKAEWNLNAD